MMIKKIDFSPFGDCHVYVVWPIPLKAITLKLKLKLDINRQTTSVSVCPMLRPNKTLKGDIASCRLLYTHVERIDKMRTYWRPTTSRAASYDCFKTD